jgi:hypothetical protein
MYRLSHLLILVLICYSCAGDNFDETTIPTEQLSAELAFKRVADHGGLEPVVEDGQAFNEWQFNISSSSRVVVMNNKTEFIYWLKDRSGIEYKVSSKSTSIGLIEQMKETSYGYATGKIVSVKRDLPAGEIAVELVLTSWREREQ